MISSTLWSNLRTIGLVTLVTLLIWVWADAETQPGRGGDLLHGDSGGSKAVEEAEFTIDALPVMLVMPATAGKVQWERVRPQQSELKNITITGPRTVIDRLKRADPTLRLAGLLVLSDEDWSAGVVSKGVELTPGGVGLRFAGPAPTVRVTVGR